MIGDQVIKIAEVDKVLLPPNDGITDLGLNDPKVPTKLTVKDDFW